MSRILILRQSEEAIPLAQELKARGWDPYVCPLYTLRTLRVPSLEGATGLIITSKNALRALGEPMDLPVYAVGDSTADFARQMGFKDVHSAAGTAADLRRCTAHLRGLVHLSGPVVREELGDVRHIVYQLDPIACLPPEVHKAIACGEITTVLLFSPLTARLFVNLVKEAASLTAVCLSDAVAQEASAIAWRTILISSQPTLEGVLAISPL